MPVEPRPGEIEARRWPPLLALALAEAIYTADPTPTPHVATLPLSRPPRPVLAVQTNHTAGPDRRRCWIVVVSTPDQPIVTAANRWLALAVPCFLSNWHDLNKVVWARAIYDLIRHQSLKFKSEIFRSIISL